MRFGLGSASEVATKNEQSTKSTKDVVGVLRSARVGFGRRLADGARAYPPYGVGESFSLLFPLAPAKRLRRIRRFSLASLEQDDR
jgi:hypothetical protein